MPLIRTKLCFVALFLFIFQITQTLSLNLHLVMTLWKWSGRASSLSYAALGRCLSFWSYQSSFATFSDQHLPPRSFLDVHCGSPPHPYSHPQSGILSCTGVWSIAQLSPWSSSTRILLAQSPRTSLRSGTLVKARTLSLSESLDEIQITDHLPSLCSFLFESQEAHPSRPLPPAPCDQSCLLFCALSFCQLMR